MHVLEAALFANLVQSPRRALRGDCLVEPQVYCPSDERETLRLDQLPPPGRRPKFRLLLASLALLSGRLVARAKRARAPSAAADVAGATPAG